MLEPVGKGVLERVHLQGAGEVSAQGDDVLLGLAHFKEPLAEAASGVLAIEGVQFGLRGGQEIEHDRNSRVWFPPGRISTERVRERSVRVACFCTEHHHVSTGLKGESAGRVLTGERNDELEPVFGALKDPAVSPSARVEVEETGFGNGDGNDALVSDTHTFHPHGRSGSKLEGIGAGEIALPRV